MEIRILADADSVAREAAAIIAGEARAAVAARGRFVVAFSGGRTPWQMLRVLAGEEVPWKDVHVVQVDERVAPEGDPDRNLTQLRESLLEHAPLRPEQLYAMPVEEKDLEAAARRYALTLREIAGSPPVLDLVHLGLGPDGHTASSGARRSGPRRYRCRRRADRGLPGEAADDLDLSDHQPLSAHPLAGDGERKGEHARAASRRRSVDSGRPGSPGPSPGARRPSGG